MLVLFGGACAEEFAPKFLGVGFPVLLVSALYLAPARQLVTSVLLALAAGAIADALSALPLMTSASFFVLAAIAIRSTLGRNILLSALAYPLYEIWLALWSVSAEGSVFMRVFLAVPIGFATAGVVHLALGWLERKAAVDAQV